MFCKDLFKRGTVVDDYVVFCQMGLGKMSTVFTAINHDLITVAMKFNLCFVNQLLFRQDTPLVNRIVNYV